MKKVIRIILSTFATVIVLGIGSCAALATLSVSAMSGMSDPAHEFLASVRANDQQRMEATLSTAFKQATSRQELLQLIERIRLNRNTSAEFSSYNLKNGTGTITGTVTIADSSQYDASFTVTKENEIWKIVGFSLTPVSGASAQAAS